MKTRVKLVSSKSTARLSFQSLASPPHEVSVRNHTLPTNRSIHRSLPEWIQAIADLWANRSADKLDSNLNLALLVREWRRSFSKRQWNPFWRSQGIKLPFKQRKAEQLIVIGEKLADRRNAHMRAHLPSGMRTLYALALLGTDLVDNLSRQGRVHPKLDLKAAKALVAEYKPETTKKVQPSPLQKRLARFSKFVQQNLPNWPRQERKLAETELLRLLQQVRRPPVNTKTEKISVPRQPKTSETKL